VVNQGRGPGQRTDPGRRPTKAERKDQARAEREQIQRTMAARRRNRRLGIVLFAAAAAIVVVVVFILQPGSSPLPSAGDLLASASAQASAAGCGSVQQTPDYPGGADLDRTHIGAGPQVTTPPPLSSYASTPPASGPHDPNPMPAGVYSSPPDVYRTIHSLEHAGAIIWYAPSAADSDAVRQIKDFYSQSDNVGQAKVIVAPFDFPSQGAAGTLPGGIQMALVAWHRLETCAQANPAAAYSFTSQYSDATPGGQYVGSAPEPGGVM
jgi:predicted nucleic acid-binding Zn ribbon protein